MTLVSLLVYVVESGAGTTVAGLGLQVSDRISGFRFVGFRVAALVYEDEAGEMATCWLKS